MEYQEFVEQVRKSVEEQAGEVVYVNVSSILKNNLAPMDGLTILRRGENVAQAIWLNPLYHWCECGVPVSQIAEEILDYHGRERKSGTYDASFYTDFSKVKDRIVCKLVHYNMNADLLLRVPHRRFLDLAVVYYYKIEDKVFGNASILITHEHAWMWRTSQQELDCLAMQNTTKLLPAEFMDLIELIEQMTEFQAGMICHQDLPMYVLTNTEKNFGAASILFPEVLRMIAGKLDGDYFVLPSSIHECIIIPALEGILPADLHEMVKEINQEHVAQEELLGDSVYRYRCQKQRLEIAYQN